ncbi:hypothetical protein AGABI1DRAFT_132522 [Agaricus bisporus var. burnettii JB137-S8]|uniref:Uncharacterized protein n=1 Tax=Agaricus bisporus var. burnettii (strain JB137-S8 / ATCC MYA-4627 / FGSC 10392) TaxID=597362 RepID=K5XKZ7_AGABU|nr:uncharacterized protein AGABI1DRAFT_132522 [Agaricus bisporus var. burnettii JB137-S8]EKM75170.1 hypothetical protein AGABI1DRAFT_132522 [Agaricus bisporus var. burnettii JB137-S8]
MGEDFRAVKNIFAALVQKYGNDFPGIENEYVPRWDGLMARWNGKAGILWPSRELAANTAAALDDYGINLMAITQIVTQDDLRAVQIQLAQYVATHPIDVSEQVADGFTNLRNDIQTFSNDYTQYIEGQMHMLSPDAKQYETEIKQLQMEITELNKKIAAPLKALGGSFALGIVESLIPLAALTILVERTTARQKLDAAKANLANTVPNQKALAAAQADFERIKPNIDDICTKLGIFASIWSFTTTQCSAINAEPQQGMMVLTSRLFQVILHFAMAQIQPLQEGMRQYAYQIVPPSAFSY